MNKNNHSRNFIWNLIFSMVQALQTVVLLLIINRVLGENEAGIFGYAFSVAVLLAFIGNFGIRNFQVSDSCQQFSPSDYYGFRIITSVFMMFVMGIFIVISSPGKEKALSIVFLTVLRFAESFEDVFHGRYQQMGDLYLSGLQGTIRYIISDILFIIVLCISKNLVISCMVYGVSSLFAMIIFAMFSLKHYGGFSLSFNLDKIKGLFLSCFPLFCGYFLSTYLTNAPKYTIESYISPENTMYNDRIQAYFNMIFMPVLMINLLSTVVFRPFITDMADRYNENRINEYKSLVYRQIFVIALIGVIVLPLCYFIGIPLLSWFYGSNLNSYNREFMILMAGGVFSAFSSFINVCIITIRRQKVLLVGSFFLVIISVILYKIMPAERGLLGISEVYLVVMILQAVIYYFIHSFRLGKKK